MHTPGSPTQADTSKLLEGRMQRYVKEVASAKLQFRPLSLKNVRYGGSPFDLCRAIVEGSFMSRLIASPIMLLAAAGCVEGSIAPGTLPKGATSGIYTTADIQTVASCIASALGSTPRPDGDRLVIVSVRHPGSSYSVRPNRRNAVYPTQIAINGTDQDADESKRVAGCVVAKVIVTGGAGQ